MNRQNSILQQSEFCGLPTYKERDLKKTPNLRFNDYHSRHDRRQKTPYDQDMVQSQKQMELCSQHNLERNPHEAPDASSLINKVATAVKNKVFTWTKGLFTESQRESDLKEGQPPLVLKQNQQINADRENEYVFENDDDSLALDCPKFALDTLQFSFMNSPLERSLRQEHPKNNSSTVSSNVPSQLDQLLSEGNYQKRKTSPQQRVNFNNFYQVQKVNQKLLEQKLQSTWTKYNISSFRSTEPRIRKSKPSNLNSLRLIIGNSKLKVATADTRDLVFGIERLRGNRNIVKPVADRAKSGSQHRMFIKRKRENIQGPRAREAAPKVRKHGDVETNLTLRLPTQELAAMNNQQQMKQNLMSSMTPEEFDQFKVKAYQSKMKGEAQDYNNLYRDQVTTLKPRVLAQQIKKTERQLNNELLSQEEKRNLYTTLRELKSMQIQLKEEREQHQQELQQQQQNFKETLEQYLKELTEQQLKREEKLIKSIADSQHSNVQIQSQQAESQAAQQLQQLSQSYQTNMKQLEEKVNQLTVEMKRANEIKLQQQTAITTPKEDIQKTSKQDFDIKADVSVQKKDPNLGKLEEKKEDSYKIKIEAVEDIYSKNSSKSKGEGSAHKGDLKSFKAPSFGQQQVEKEHALQSFESFKSENIDTPQSKANGSLKSTSPIQPKDTNNKTESIFQLNKPVDINKQAPMSEGATPKLQFAFASNFANNIANSAVSKPSEPKLLAQLPESKPANIFGAPLQNNPFLKTADKPAPNIFGSINQPASSQTPTFKSNDQKPLSLHAPPATFGKFSSSNAINFTGSNSAPFNSSTNDMMIEEKAHYSSPNVFNPLSKPQVSGFPQIGSLPASNEQQIFPFQQNPSTNNIQNNNQQSNNSFQKSQNPFVQMQQQQNNSGLQLPNNNNQFKPNFGNNPLAPSSGNSAPFQLNQQPMNQPFSSSGFSGPSNQNFNSGSQAFNNPPSSTFNQGSSAHSFQSNMNNNSLNDSGNNDGGFTIGGGPKRKGNNGGEEEDDLFATKRTIYKPKRFMPKQ